MKKSDYLYPGKDRGGKATTGQKKKLPIYVFQKYFILICHYPRFTYKTTKVHIVNQPFPSHHDFKIGAFSWAKCTMHFLCSFPSHANTL